MEEVKDVIDWVIHYVQGHDCEICGKHNENPILWCNVNKIQ